MPELLMALGIFATGIWVGAWLASGSPTMLVVALIAFAMILKLLGLIAWEVRRKTGS